MTTDAGLTEYEMLAHFDYARWMRPAAWSDGSVNVESAMGMLRDERLKDLTICAVLRSRWEILPNATRSLVEWVEDYRNVWSDSLGVVFEHARRELRWLKPGPGMESARVALELTQGREINRVTRRWLARPEYAGVTAGAVYDVLGDRWCHPSFVCFQLCRACKGQGIEDSLPADAPARACKACRGMRSHPVKPSWLTDQALSIARKASARDADAFFPLADCLEESGCEDRVLLDHLRGRQLHYVGCWAVDHLCGKRSPFGFRRLTDEQAGFIVS